MNYNIVSLGSACQMKYNIDRIFKKQETNFFDWLFVDFKSVLYVLKNINDKQLITQNKFTNEDVFAKGYNSSTKCHKIEHKETILISAHDFPNNIHYMDSMNDFIKKYNRRLDRLKYLINSNENIHMIHCIDHQFTDGYIITNDDISNFKRYLCNINPNNNCFLHIAIPPKYNNIDFNNLIQEKVYIYYLHDTKEVSNQWANTNFNWNIIFDNINNIK